MILGICIATLMVLANVAHRISKYEEGMSTVHNHIYPNCSYKPRMISNGSYRPRSF